MRGRGEWSRIGSANSEARKIRAKTTLWRENILRHEVICPLGKERKYCITLQRFLGYIASHSGPCNGGGKGFKLTKTREQSFGRWGVL